MHKGTLTNILIVNVTSERDEYFLKVGVTEFHLPHQDKMPVFWAPLGTEYFLLPLMEA